MYSYSNDVFTRLEFRRINEKREFVSFGGCCEHRGRIVLHFTRLQVETVDFLAIDVRDTTIIANQLADEFLCRLRIRLNGSPEEGTDVLIIFVIAKRDSLFDVVIAVTKRACSAGARLKWIDSASFPTDARSRDSRSPTARV